jgi:hypothetical protein
MELRFSDNPRERKATMSDVTLTQLKYADLLGKPLTKSLYRQLPNVEESLLEVVNGAYQWRATIHGRINWCPPGCDVETSCDCINRCLGKAAQCKQKRSHQHLLIGSHESLCQGFIYDRLLEYDDDLFMLDDAWTRYHPLEEARTTLQRKQREDPLPNFLSTWGTYDAQQWQEIKHRISERTNRLAVIEKTLARIDAESRQAQRVWTEAALSLLPVILLRG